MGRNDWTLFMAAKKNLNMEKWIEIVVEIMDLTVYSRF